MSMKPSRTPSMLSSTVTATSLAFSAEPAAKIPCATRCTKGAWGRAPRPRRSSFRRSSGSNHSCRPALHESSETIERLGEVLSGGGEAQTEMRGHIEAIAGRQQDAMLGGSLAERALMFSAHQPGERGHAALRRDPAEHVAVVRQKSFEQLEVSRGGGLGLAQNNIALANGDFGKNLAGGGVGDRKVGARVPVLLAAPGVVLDHPSRP